MEKRELGANRNQKNIEGRKTGSMNREKKSESVNGLKKTGRNRDFEGIVNGNGDINGNEKSGKIKMRRIWSGSDTPGRQKAGEAQSGKEKYGNEAVRGKKVNGQHVGDKAYFDKTYSNEKKSTEKSVRKLCSVYNKCGGCQLLHLPYKKQLEQKQKMMEEMLTGLCPVKPIIGMQHPFHYRNKVHAVFGHDSKGNALSGIYKEGTHFLIPIETCMIEDEKADEIIGTIRGMLRSFKILTYDEDTGYGFLRHVLVKRGFVTGEIMIVLVTASPIFPSKNNFVKALRGKHPEITTIIQNINDRSTGMVLGNKEHVLYGKGFIEDELCGYRFRISAKSFYQVNPIQAEVLYKKVIELAKLTGKETVLDAYCGVGTIGLIASKYAGNVIGVELNQDAVKDAVQNAKKNGVKNIQFYCNDAGRFMSGMAERGEKADVVLMDPPRSGSTKEFIDALAAMSPSRVIYVSCGPETLERDLRMFKAKGYKAVEAWPVDMFAQTKHVETVTLLVRKP